MVGVQLLPHDFSGHFIIFLPVFWQIFGVLQRYKKAPTSTPTFAEWGLTTPLADMSEKVMFFFMPSPNAEIRVVPDTDLSGYPAAGYPDNNFAGYRISG